MMVQKYDHYVHVHHASGRNMVWHYENTMFTNTIGHRKRLNQYGGQYIFNHFLNYRMMTNYESKNLLTIGGQHSIENKNTITRQALLAIVANVDYIAKMKTISLDVGYYQGRRFEMRGEQQLASFYRNLTPLLLYET
jgi:hypothetical protein